MITLSHSAAHHAVHPVHMLIAQSAASPLNGHAFLMDLEGEGCDLGNRDFDEGLKRSGSPACEKCQVLMEYLAMDSAICTDFKWKKPFFRPRVPCHLGFGWVTLLPCLISQIGQHCAVPPSFLLALGHTMWWEKHNINALLGPRLCFSPLQFPSLLLSLLLSSYPVQEA